MAKSLFRHQKAGHDCLEQYIPDVAVTAKSLDWRIGMCTTNCLVNCSESICAIVHSSWVVSDQEEKIDRFRVIDGIKESLFFNKIRSFDNF